MAHPSLKRTASVAEEPEYEDNEKECRTDGTDRPGITGSRSEELNGFGSPLVLRDCLETVRQTIDRFENGSKLERRQIVTWILPAFRELALAQNSCRLLQEIIVEVAGPEQVSILRVIESHLEELYESPHGNHVIAKVIEVMPSGTLGPLIMRFRGRSAAVARHRFGCRVLERLLEHCSEAQLGPLLDEIAADAVPLSLHIYGNFVVQHIFEHGSRERQLGLLRRVLPAAATLAVHRSGSHVVQRAIAYCDSAGQRLIADALLNRSSLLLDLANNKYGSYVVEELAAVALAKAEVQQKLVASLSVVAASATGRRTLECCGLLLPPTEKAIEEDGEDEVVEEEKELAPGGVDG